MEKHSFLIILEGDPYEKNECLPLPNSGKIIIGRSYGEHIADISFKSLFISRTHAIVECRNGRYYIKDLSKHGTYVNNKKLEKEKEYELKNGDVISLANGDAILVCQLGYMPGETLEYIDVNLVKRYMDLEESKKEDLVFEEEKRKVKIFNVEYELSGRELKLFELLFKNKNKIVSVDEIIEYIWPQRVDSKKYEVSPEEVRQVVYRLRKRLDPYGNRLIKTFRGEGFMLEISE